MSIEVELVMENNEDVKRALSEFGPELESELFGSYERLAMQEEKMLKSTTGFKDVTGRLRRSLFVVASRFPLGIEFGSYLSYSYYVAMGHGTWFGGWWVDYLSQAVPRVVDAVEKVLERLVGKYNAKGGE